MSKMLPAVFSIDCGGGLKLDKVVLAPDGQMHGRDLFGAEALTVSREIFGVLSTSRRGHTTRLSVKKPGELVIVDDGKEVARHVIQDTACIVTLKFRKRGGISGFFVEKVPVTNKATGEVELVQPIDKYKFCLEFKGLGSIEDNDADNEAMDEDDAENGTMTGVTPEAVHSPEEKARLLAVHRERVAKRPCTPVLIHEKRVLARVNTLIGNVRTFGYDPCEPFQVGNFLVKLRKLLKAEGINSAEFMVEMREVLGSVRANQDSLPKIEGPSEAMLSLRRVVLPKHKKNEEIEVDSKNDQPAPGEIYNGDETTKDDPTKPVEKDLEERVQVSGAYAYLELVIKKYTSPDHVPTRFQRGNKEAFNVQSFLQSLSAAKKVWTSERGIDQTNSCILNAIDEIKRVKDCIRQWRNSIKKGTHLVEKDLKALKREVRKATKFIKKTDEYVRSKIAKTFAKKTISPGIKCFVRDSRFPPESGDLHHCVKGVVVGYEEDTRATVIEHRKGVTVERMKFYLPDHRVHFNRNAALGSLKQQAVRDVSKPKKAGAPKKDTMPKKDAKPIGNKRRLVDSDEEVPGPKDGKRRKVAEDSDDEKQDNQEFEEVVGEEIGDEEVVGEEIGDEEVVGEEIGDEEVVVDLVADGEEADADPATASTDCETTDRGECETTDAGSDADAV